MRYECSGKSTSDLTDLVLQTQCDVPIKEDPAVERAQRALAKQLEAQDPRLFAAVLKLAKEIQQESEYHFEQITQQRAEGLQQLLEVTKRLKEEFIHVLEDATTSEVRSIGIAIKTLEARRSRSACKRPQPLVSL